MERLSKVHQKNTITQICVSLSGLNSRRPICLPLAYLKRCRRDGKVCASKIVELAHKCEINFSGFQVNPPLDQLKEGRTLRDGPSNQDDTSVHACLQPPQVDSTHRNFEATLPVKPACACQSRYQEEVQGCVEATAPALTENVCTMLTVTVL